MKAQLKYCDKRGPHSRSSKGPTNARAVRSRSRTSRWARLAKGVESSRAWLASVRRAIGAARKLAAALRAMMRDADTDHARPSAI